MKIAYLCLLAPQQRIKRVFKNLGLSLERFYKEPVQVNFYY